MKNKILIVGPSWVGDMVMAQVLFQLLRQQQPDADIHVLAPLWSEALLSRMPEVQKSLVLPFKHGELNLRARYRFAKQLRSENYTQAIVLPNSLKSALIPFFARIPKRTGFVGEQRFGLLNDVRRLNKKALPTMVERFAALAFPKNTVLPAQLPNPVLSVTSTSQRPGFEISVDTTKPVLILCPGAEFGPSKCWPPKHFAAVANQKLAEGWQVWLLGSSNDRKIADDIQIQTQSRCCNLVGKTSLSEAVDLLSLANVVVTNDSGLMHMAAAVNVKVIAVYGSTSPHFTPPLSDNAVIVKLNLECQPCFKRVCPLKHHACMETLKPEMVLMYCHAVI